MVLPMTLPSISPLSPFKFIYRIFTLQTNFVFSSLSLSPVLLPFQLQKLILSGELPCSKEEAAVLAVIQLRIEETAPQSKENASRRIGSMLPSASLRQSSIIDEKLRPICEDVKVCLPLSQQKLDNVG